MRAHRFAGAGFTDDADDPAGSQVQRDAVDREGTFGALGQCDPQILDGDGGRCGHDQRPSRDRRGLSASLRPSPIKLSPSTEIRMATPGNTVIHQAWRITVRPAPTM